MTQSLTQSLLNILTASTLEQAAAHALAALVAMLRPTAACLLVWDGDMERYIIGATWPHDLPRADAAQLRREALRLGMNAFAADPDRARCIEPRTLYLPFNDHARHVGALIGWGVDHVPASSAAFEQLCHAIPRGLHTVTRLEQADRERDARDTEHERLETLLQAVERQQRTIDRLLATERELSASLEVKVEERTAALRAAQKRLIQSEKLAVIGQLASSLAHELNNPMQAIQSGLGLVMCEIEGGNPDVVREDLRIMQEELERIDAIFRQMLDFYRPVTFDTVPLDLNAIAEGVRVLMRKRLQEAHVTLNLDLTPDLPLTCGDNNQIKQVVINLILNAAEALAPAGGTITVRTSYDAAWAYFAVIDDGPGIAPEHHARLFEPLFTTKPRGLGLGLAISQDIIQRHAGLITVESAPGAGTTFTIRLPIREQCNHDHNIREAADR